MITIENVGLLLDEINAANKVSLELSVMRVSSARDSGALSVAQANALTRAAIRRREELDHVSKAEATARGGATKKARRRARDLADLE